jgi:hypothetical protein
MHFCGHKLLIHPQFPFDGGDVQEHGELRYIE